LADVHVQVETYFLLDRFYGFFVLKFHELITT